MILRKDNSTKLISGTHPLTSNAIRPIKCADQAFRRVGADRVREGDRGPRSLQVLKKWRTFKMKDRYNRVIYGKAMRKKI